MLAQRSLIRAPQLDADGSYKFAQLTIDGYSGGETQDGYLMGLILKDGYAGGTEKIRMDAHTGAINQIGTGQVTFNGNVDAKNGLDVSGGDLTVATNAHIQGWTIIEGDLTVNGTTTTIDTQELVVADPVTVINASGNEAGKKWSGLSAHDADGYNRTGWVFSGAGVGSLDGYWAVSITASDGPDAVPVRALAYLGAGDAYGDLSSRISGNSGADKIGVSATGGLTAVNVQLALEGLVSEDGYLQGELSELNTDVNDEINDRLQADGYLQGELSELNTDVNDEINDRLQADGYLQGELSELNTDVNDEINDRLQADGYLQGELSELNTDVNDEINDRLQADGYLQGELSELNTDLNDYMAAMAISITTGDLTATGNVTLGSPGKCITFAGDLCSDIVPCCNDAYMLGSSTQHFIDGYFTHLHVDYETIAYVEVTNMHVNTLIVDGYSHLTGTTILGKTPADCVTFIASLCSNITPCCDDAYMLGDSTHEFLDGYFKYLHVSSELALGDTTVTNLIDTGDLTVSGDTTLSGNVTLGSPGKCITFEGNVCSDILPCCDDAYHVGDTTHRFSDGYFVNLWVSTEHIGELIIDNTTINNVTVDGYAHFNGEVVLGNSASDCVIFNASLCSNITPCCDDAYMLGNATHKFLDGYFDHLHVSDGTSLGDTTVSKLTDTGDLGVTGDTTLAGLTAGTTGLGDTTVDSLIDNGDATLSGNVILGSPGKCITFDGYLCSSIIPCCDDAYQLGNSTHRFIDGYFAMPTFTKITPVGNNNSLIGVLKGIDNSISSIVFSRGVYRVTVDEDTANAIDTTRTVDQGVSVDVSGLTDAQFSDTIYIYWNGQLLWNDSAPAADVLSVQQDVARKSGDLKTILFAGNLMRNSVIQIVNLAT